MLTLHKTDINKVDQVWDQIYNTHVWPQSEAQVWRKVNNKVKHQIIMLINNILHNLRRI